MANRLKEKGIELEHLVSSPAKRAKKTAKYFAEEFRLKKEDIKLVEALYGATQPQFLQAIKEIEDKYKTVALFSHNPGITDFASSLTNVRVDDMPTCAIFALQIETDIVITSLAPGAGPTRTYENLDELVEDVWNARVWGGLHYRSTVEQTSKDFPRIAKDVGKRYFLDPSGPDRGPIFGGDASMDGERSSARAGRCSAQL